MLKILKWTAITAITLGVGSYAVFGGDAFSYVTTALSSARSHVKEQIPVEFELERAEKMVHAIEPEIVRCERDLAEAEVDLRDLERSVVQLSDTVEHEESHLRRQSEELTGAGSEGEHRLTSHRSGKLARIELERVFDSYRSNVEILKTKESMVERQTQMVAAAKQRLATVSAEKSRLEDQIMALRAQKKWLDAAAAESTKFELDDTALAQARDALAGVQRRLDVTQQMIENRSYFDGEAIHSSSPERDILSEISEHFDEPRGNLGTVEAATGR